MVGQVLLDRVDQWGGGVAGVDGSQSAGAQHLDGEQGRGRLAVGAGDREHRPWTTGPLAFPSVGELDLGGQLDAERLCGRHHCVGLGHTWGRAHEIARRHQVPQGVGVGTFEEFDAQLGGESCAAVVDHVVRDDDIDAVAQQRADGRLAGDCEAVHQCPTHGWTVTTEPGR